MVASPPASKTVHTMCPMNCHPTYCGMLVTVQDGKLLQGRGRPGPSRQPRLPLRAGPVRPRDPGQPAAALPSPSLRRGPRGSEQWEQISWDDAMDRIIDGDPAGREGAGRRLDRPRRRASAGSATRWRAASATSAASSSGTRRIVCWALGGYGLQLTGTH